MSAIHFASVVNATQRRDDAFAPTLSGRETTDSPGSQHVVYANGDDFELSPVSASANGYAGVWVIQTATDCFVRCGADATGNLADEDWYNTSGAAQGDPGSRAGTGTTVFQLNETCDEVRISHSGDVDVIGTCTYGNITGGGGYTAGSFFTPTQDTKYGREVLASSSQSGLGSTTEIGYTEIEITFRSSGKADYTVSFTARGRAIATVDI